MLLSGVRPEPQATADYSSYSLHLEENMRSQFVSTILISALMAVQPASAVDLETCKGSQAKQIGCLNRNTATLNNALDGAVRDLRSRLEKIEARVLAGWDTGCTNGVCVSVNARGNLIFFDGSQKQITGKGQIPGTVTAPVSVTCNNLPGQEGCVASDGDGRLWIGSPRANNYVFITQIPSNRNDLKEQPKETKVPPIGNKPCDTAPNC